MKKIILYVLAIFSMCLAETMEKSVIVIYDIISTNQLLAAFFSGLLLLIIAGIAKKYKFLIEISIKVLKWIFDKLRKIINVIWKIICIIGQWFKIIFTINKIMKKNEKHKKEIEESLKKNEEKNQEDFNAAYKKIAEVFYILARDKLIAVSEAEKEELKNELWIGHFMSLAGFYFNLGRMNAFSNNELYFIGYIKDFTIKYKNIPMPNIKFFYHFLQFIEHSEKINEAISKEAEITYKELLRILGFDKVKEYIKNSDFRKERIQKILILAERYGNKMYLEDLGIKTP